MQLNLKKSERGFGLMEMVVVTAIFSITMTVIVTILVNTLGFQKKVKAEQIVVGAARDAIETLAREIRLGYIDYMSHLDTSPGEFDSPIGFITINTSSGETLIFKVVDDKLVAEGTATYPISSSDINITGLQFYVRPESDPYWIEECENDTQCNPAVVPVEETSENAGTCTPAGICEVEDVQPRVTIVMRAEAANPAPGNFVSIDLQTTVTARQYLR